MGWLSLCPTTSFSIETKLKLPSLPPRTPSDMAATAARLADPNSLDWRPPSSGPSLAPATSHTLHMALALLRDHLAMISLNPLVQSYELIRDPDYRALGLAPPDGPPVKRDVYRITDTIPVAFLGRTWWNGSTTYVARFEDGARYMATQTRAQWGVSNSVLWRLKTVVEGEDEVVELTESVTVHLPFFLRPFVAATVRKAHGELREAFVERLRHLEDMKVRRIAREEDMAKLGETKEVDEGQDTAKQDEGKEAQKEETTEEGS